MKDHDILAALETSNHKLVLAESCTGGLAVATLAQIPGISKFLCGSAVTYRPEAKKDWLGIPATLIEQYTAESAEVTQAMCRGVLQQTPEATIGGAITGHLGPNAATDKDGVIYISIAKRVGDEIVQVTCVRRVLKEEERVSRQIEASQILIKLLQSSL